jgi:phosphatidylserine synthase
MIIRKKAKDYTRLLFWRFLTYTWAVITATFFALDYFKILDCSNSLKTLTIVYISILSIFTSIKEFHRWKDKKFLSKYRGEIFVVIYTILIIIFIILSTINPKTYSIRPEFTTTYLAILGIFAISYNSKYLKNK